MNFNFIFSEWYLRYLEVLLILTIFANYCFYLSKKGKRDNIKGANLLLVMLIINVVCATIPLFFPAGFSFSPSIMTDSERLFLSQYVIVTSLLPSIPLILSYGILFIIFGALNRKNLGWYLIAAGISWSIYYGFQILTLDGQLFFVIELMTNNFSLYSIDIYYNLIFFESIFRIFSYIPPALIIIYGFLKSEKYFLYAGLIFFLIPFIMSPLSVLVSYFTNPL